MTLVGIGKVEIFFVKTYSQNYDYPITTPSGRIVWPPKSRSWVTSEERFNKLVQENRIYFGVDGDNIPRYKRFLSDVKDGIVPTTLWMRDEVGDNQEAKKEVKQINAESVFSTPKPERLIQRIIHIASNPGDIVLDSFLGSGTTAAVAHKMGRRYIGIEMGDHALSHCVPRLRKVIEGEQGGISKSVEWSGGGGFRFFRLGAHVFDAEGRICTDIRFPALAAHIWFSETNTPWNGGNDGPALGIHNGIGYALLYNGVLGDKRPHGGNVLTKRTLDIIRDDLSGLGGRFAGPLVIYGEGSRIGAERLKQEGIVFRQTPYDVTVR